MTLKEKLQEFYTNKLRLKKSSQDLDIDLE